MSFLMNAEIEGSSQLRIEHPSLQSLYKLWDARRGIRRFPTRRDFLPEADLHPWMGHLGIVEVEYCPQRFRVRLAGTEVAQYDGADFTGHYLDEIVPPNGRAEILSPYHACLRDQAPQYSSFVPPLPGATYRKLHRLLLPCSSNGSEIDQIIVGIYAENWDRLRHRSIYEPM
jgi:hypothetical protein